MVTITQEGLVSLQAMCKEFNVDMGHQIAAISLGMAIGLHYPEYAVAFCSLVPNSRTIEQELAEEFVQNVPLEGILTP